MNSNQIIKDYYDALCIMFIVIGLPYYVNYLNDEMISSPLKIFMIILLTNQSQKTFSSYDAVILHNHKL